MQAIKKNEITQPSNRKSVLLDVRIKSKNRYFKVKVGVIEFTCADLYRVNNNNIKCHKSFLP